MKPKDGNLIGRNIFLSNDMISACLIFNNDGKIRLMNFYSSKLSVKQQIATTMEIYEKLRLKKANSSNFIEFGEEKVIFRNYATLYFCFICSDLESELAILDLIQVFVEQLDKVFTNVCELDLIFRPDDVQLVLSEIVCGGMVLEVNQDVIQAGLQISRAKAK